MHVLICCNCYPSIGLHGVICSLLNGNEDSLYLLSMHVCLFLARSLSKSLSLSLSLSLSIYLSIYLPCLSLSMYLISAPHYARTHRKLSCRRCRRLRTSRHHTRPARSWSWWPGCLKIPEKKETMRTDTNDCPASVCDITLDFSGSSLYTWSCCEWYYWCCRCYCCYSVVVVDVASGVVFHAVGVLAVVVGHLHWSCCDCCFFFCHYC